MEDGLSFDEAREMAAAGNIFTTHTPVPAGIDVFPPELLWKFLSDFVGTLGITFDQFFELGQETSKPSDGLFSMAVLAIRLSAHKNAVSRLHARVSRRLWRDVTPDLPLSEVRIGRITNGVHPATWTAPEIASLSVFDRPDQADRGEFWRRREALRARLVDLARERIAPEKAGAGARGEDVEAARRELDSKALTIGFARRVLAVGLMRRFLTACQTIRAILRQGILGDVQSFRFAEGGTFRWPTHSTTYFQRSTAAGGVLADIGTHLLDLITWWMGEPSEIRYEDDAMGGVETNCLIELKFAEGFAGVARLSRDCELQSRCFIRGSKGWLSWSVDAPEELQMRFDGALSVVVGRLHEHGASRALPGRVTE